MTSYLQMDVWCGVAYDTESFKLGIWESAESQCCVFALDVLYAT